MICPYCDKHAIFTTSESYYGKDYGTNLYYCKDCDARVGTHGRSDNPLGTMANHDLRELRKRCHSLIDPYWKKGKMSRQAVYRRMAKAMGLTTKEAHIGMFDTEQCYQLIRLFNDKNFH